MFIITIPDNLLPILQDRQTFCFITNLSGTRLPHDLNMQELSDLDELLTRDDTDEAHNMVIDGRQLSLLKRFLEAERVIIGRSYSTMMPNISNVDYWNLLGELLTSVIRPTILVNLSFLTE